MSLVSQTIRTVVSIATDAACGRLRHVPIHRVTNEFAFSFGDAGWNYFRALVAEYDERPDTPFAETLFHQFFQHEAVRRIRYLEDVLFLHERDKPARAAAGRFYLGTYPWGDHVSGGPWGYHFDSETGKSTRDLYGYRGNIWHTPGDSYPLEREWRKTIQLYESVRHGYRPIRHGRIPQVTLLRRLDGETIAIRYNGQHRLAILGHLGYKHVTVSVPSATEIGHDLASWPTASTAPKHVSRADIVVEEANVAEWYYVKHGLCTARYALEIFHAFFELNGRERIRSLGLPTAY